MSNASTDNPAHRLQWHGIALAAMLVAFCPLLSAAAATGASTRLPATETEKKAFDAIRTNQLQLAVSTVVRAPEGEKVLIAELADEHGMTALHWVAMNRNAAGIRWLMDKGADLELKDDQGRTPLKIALDHQDTRVMSLLIDRGANPKTALPGHDEELKALEKTDEIVDYMIWTDAPAAAAALYQKTCSTEEPGTCFKLGLRYHNGDGVPKDLAKSAALFSTGCDGGNAQACYNIALSHALGEGVPKDAAKAVAPFTKACDGGIPAACTDLGYRYRNGQGVTKDIPKAAALYWEACSRGEPTACLNLGLLYNTGEGVPKDLAKAAPLYRTACDAGAQTIQACHWLAGLHSNGEGVPKDTATAVALYQKACDGKYAASCAVLGTFYYLGEVLPKDLTKAAALFERACDGDSGTGCRLLSMSYGAGDGVAPDKTKAALLLAKACKLGDQQACKPTVAAAPAATTAAPAAATTAAAATVSPCKLVRVQLGVDTVASVERDIQLRGGSPLVGGGGHGKYTINSLSGDYPEVGPTLMAVNYDFDAAGPAGRLVAVTVVRKVDFNARYAKLASDRKAALAKVFGPLKAKSATESTGAAAGCEVTVHENPDTGFLYEVYKLAN